MKGLQIFKPGKHTASDGSVHDFTEARLRGCVESYDPALREAPLVIGHPKTDDPAYGWVKALAFNEETLDALPHQVNPEFAQLVNAGAFKKISASFYLEDAPGNPKPGKLYLRHIGFLGAKAPAIPGLKSASFAADEKGVVEFADWNGLAVAGLFRKIKNYFIEQSGQEKADAILPEWEIENLTVSAAQKADPSPAFNAPEEGASEMDKAELARQQAETKAAQDKLANDRAEFAQSQAQARTVQIRTAAAAFVDSLVKDGKVLPAQAAGLVAFMAALPADGIVEFGEADKAVKKPSAEWFRGYLAAQPKVVEFAEHGHQGVLPKDLTAVEISKRAVEFQEAEHKAGRTVSVSAAVQHVTAQAGAQ